ncbi:TetR/AcrR family transcriptional regulator [Spirillospora sp. NPDC048911]|uniref:TetR/AcrR family transcriptional regulator n=1 Tax=Spirillospora sp. NPDC048911 TaxID=3364527 RepID=UPI0037156ACC
MSASRTARERVRAELINEITEIARRQLATVGATGLSLRAVAREMGMVSSAIYRYFPSRDDLLTALITDGYNAVGEVVERADAESPQDDYAARWLAVCRAIREWAVAHPHEYALIYGSPVPGYAAPQDTVPAALRDTVVFARIVTEAHEAGELDPPAGLPPVPASIGPDLGRGRAAVELNVPDDVVARALMAWAALYGTVSFELFGQFGPVIENRIGYFDHTAMTLGRLIGFKL